MKKFLSVTLLFVMLVMAVSTVVNAATTTSLTDDIYAKLKDYGATESDKVQIERVLKESKVTDENAEVVLAKVDEVVAIMKDAGVTDYKTQSAKLESKKAELKNIAVAVADTLEVKLDIKGDTVKVLNKDGKVITSITSKDGKILAYTGSTINVAFVASIVAIIALAMTVVAKKTVFANAR